MTNDQALEALDRERRKFLDGSRAEMERLCNLLVASGAYPAFSKMGPSALQMVECHGPWWHQFNGYLNCPSCGADLRDLEHGPPYKREMAFIANDRLHHFDCPDCGHSFGHAD